MGKISSRRTPEPFAWDDTRGARGARLRWMPPGPDGLDGRDSVSDPGPGSFAADGGARARAIRTVTNPVGRCRTITTEAAFHELRDLWSDLANHSASQSPFRSWDFAVEWFEHFVKPGTGGATGRFQVVLAADPAGLLIGLLPLFEERISVGRSDLGTTLQPFGRASSFETMTDEPIVLLRRGHERAAVRELKAEVHRRSGLCGWDIAVILEPARCRPSSALSISVSGDFRDVELMRHRPGPMTLRLPESWEGFKNQLSKSMRDNVSHYPRKLTRDLGAWNLRWARSPAEVAIATEVLIALHHQRSRSRIGTAHSSHIPSEAHARFLRRWFQRLACRDRISIGTLEIGGETVAAQTLVETSHGISVYYSGYDDRFYHYSPLTIILAEAIRDAVARGFDRVEFPPLSIPWKSRWGAVEEGGTDETSIYATALPALFRGAARRIAWRRSVK